MNGLNSPVGLAEHRSGVDGYGSLHLNQTLWGLLRSRSAMTDEEIAIQAGLAVVPAWVTREPDGATDDH